MDYIEAIENELGIEAKKEFYPIQPGDVEETFSNNQELEKWINVIDIENQSNFRRKYNIMGTPRLYLLDKNKVIIAKQIDSSTLEEILNKRIN